MKRHAGACLAPFFLIATAGAQTWPSKPLRIVTPFPAGGGTDFVARIAAQKLGEQLGQNVLVDNRAGAGGIIGTELAARAPGDGYTLLMGSNGPLAILPNLRTKLPYDVNRDLAPIGLVCVMPYVFVVHPVLPVKNVKELVALAKSRPGQLNYGSPGIGATNHLSVELLKTLAGIDLVHVPYKGVPPALADLVAGQVQFMSGDLSTVLPQVKAGRLRALATTGLKRSSLVPELPTVAENGVPGYEATGWFGLLAPAGLDKELVNRLNASLVRGVADKDARSRLTALGGDVMTGTPDQFAAHIRAESAKWAKIITVARVKSSPTGS
ncbi:MAG: tripartite tricarboxylate transporter substrate binding protein [Betaproteobacteria bacterium]|nr:MAG: tripartite tricarboxylate transporter substrate binding protein [Betaproteobacteria bacterium]